MHRCLLPLYFLIFVSLPAAAQQDSRKVCEDSEASADLTILHCTKVLDSIQDAKNGAWAFYNRGLAYGQKGDLDREIADYDQAIRLNPKDAKAFHNRGFAYGEKGDLDREIADYDQAIRLDPKYAKAFYNRGGVYGQKGDLDREIADYDQAIRLNPKYAKAFYNRGIAYGQKGDRDRAIADYDQVIRLNPLDAKAFRIRGITYREKGDLDRAIADFDQAIRLDPKDALAFYSRGNAYREKDDLDRAIADYDQAIRLEPDFTLLYSIRARASLYSGDQAKALADLTQAAAMNPKDHYTALWLDIVNKRSQLQSQLGEATKQLDMTKWPAPVIRLYMGQLTPQALLAAAEDPDAEKKAEQGCDVDFYTGQWQLQRGYKRQATALFEKALSSCSKTSREHEAARQELKALDVR